LCGKEEEEGKEVTKREGKEGVRLYPSGFTTRQKKTAEQTGANKKTRVILTFSKDGTFLPPHIMNPHNTPANAYKSIRIIPIIRISIIEVLSSRQSIRWR